MSVRWIVFFMSFSLEYLQYDHFSLQVTSSSSKADIYVGSDFLPEKTSVNPLWILGLYINDILLLSFEMYTYIYKFKNLYTALHFLKLFMLMCILSLSQSFTLFYEIKISALNHNVVVLNIGFELCFYVKEVHLYMYITLCRVWYIDK